MPRPLPPSRTRRIAKWTGLVVCVVILGMWAVSTKVEVYRFGDPLTFHSLYGFVSIFVRSPIVPRVSVVRTVPWDHLLRLPRWRESKQQIIIELPYWLPLLLAAIPTAILWLRDRRTVKPGCCLTCGYDLRASKKTCPECGTAVPKQETTA